MKRGKVCKYFVTKRAGRKQGSRSGIKTQHPTPTNIDTSQADADVHGDLVQAGVPHESNGYTEMLPDSGWLPTPDSTSAPTPGNFILDEIFGTSTTTMTLLPSPTADQAGVPAMDYGAGNKFFGSVDITNYLGMEGGTWSTTDSIVETPTLLSPQVPPPGRSFNPIDLLGARDPRFSSSCCCLDRALDLLKGIFPSPLHGSPSPGSKAFQNGTNQPLEADQVIERNRNASEMINDMLECLCAQDSYVLSIISLTTFKIMSSYEAAVRELFLASEEERSPNVVDGSARYTKQPLESRMTADGYAVYGMHGEGYGQLATQQVLRDLKRVLQLVNTLSQRLKTHEARTESTDASENSTYETSGYVWNVLCPLFNSLLSQLDIDLRRQLRAVSAKIAGPPRESWSP